MIASWGGAVEQSDEADEAPALQRSARLRAPASSSRASQLIRVLGSLVRHASSYA